MTASTSPLPQRAANEKDSERLQKLFDVIKREPNNMDANFAYANLAVKMGKTEEAIATYERMLILNPELARVKLDLALLLMRTGGHDQARTLFKEVLATNPPAQVERNIRMMLTRLDKAQKKHNFSMILGVGANYDRNANSASSSGNVEFFGVPIPLDDSSQAQADTEKFAMMNAKHTYILPTPKQHTINTEAMVYKGYRQKFSNLETSMFSIKTGVTYNMPSIRSRAGFDVGYSNVQLGHHNYLDTVKYTGRFTHILHPKVMVTAQLDRERRRFHNSPVSSLFEDRNGRAHGQKLTLNIPVNNKNQLAISAAFRQERTRQKYYDNNQSSVQMSYTRSFKDGWFFNATGLMKKAQYKGIDVSVNPTLVRTDLEKTYTLALGKKLTDNLTASLSYQNKEVNSNIETYKFNNERISASLIYQFEE